MLTDISQTKNYKSKTQPNQQLNQPPNQVSEPYVNPIIKHTLQSLPLIYGGNQTRKKKYKVFMKNKFQLSNFLSKNNNRPFPSNQKLYKKLDQFDEQRQRGKSCMQMNPKKQKITDEREQIAKTVLKHRKHLSTQSGHSPNLQQKLHQGLITPKNKKNVNLQAMHMLSKPKQRCNKQYCSCKSLYDEYQQQIKKKLKQNSQNNIENNRKQNSSKIQFPRITTQMSNKSPSKLDDEESQHKVSFRYKINNMEQEDQTEGECCYLCQKNKKHLQKAQSKGLLGLIKKKQQEERKNNLVYQSRTQNVGIQSGDLLEDQNQNRNQDFGIQANLAKTNKKHQTVDQECNTEFQDQSRGFKYLQNNKGLKQSNTKHNKKQPLQHLSHLKEIYKYKKRPSYQSKYGQNEDSSSYNCNDEDSQSYFTKSNEKSNLKRSKKRPIQQQDQFDMNMSNQSIISDNSIMNHLADALMNNGGDKNTIFKLLKQRQKEESERQNSINYSKNRKRSKSKKQQKNMKIINEDTGLFSIPEEQQYVDYLKNYQPILKDFKIKNLIKSDNFRVIKYKDTLYFGQTQGDNKKHGKALFISPKQIFQGVYENGIKMSGCQRNIDGVYIGQFLNGLRHGQGKWIWNNGEVYEGEWRLGTKNGYGVWKSPKGDSYEGEWLLNRQQGKGIHKHKNSIYEGQFIQALKEGHGRQKYINGDQYIGQYLQGKPHGKGKYIWKNGNYYEGDFKDGLRSGIGKWYFSDKSYYEGQFKNDFKHGKGKQVSENGDIYEGQYIEGERTNGVLFQKATGKRTQIRSNKININTEQVQLKQSKQPHIKQKGVNQKQQVDCPHNQDQKQKQNESQNSKVDIQIPDK